jgi:hypothetical protein
MGLSRLTIPACKQFSLVNAAALVLAPAVTGERTELVRIPVSMAKTVGNAKKPEMQGAAKA